ncbi:MAG: tetratricopeptide repeat protein [Saprospiraceae bacterium]
MPHSNSRIPVILLAFANDAAAPLRGLALEQDALSEALDRARRDGKCEIITLAAATPDKIIKAFQQHQGRIRIFHYGGHSDQESLFLRKDFPDQNNTKASHLAEFLGTQEDLELVFINGCLSAGQAAFYHRSGVPTVIVTDRAIGDLAAREFAQLWYQSLAGGTTISDAFQAAETAYRVKHGDLPRGIGLSESEEGSPWQLFPEGPHPWRLPLVAKHLTRIPTIDLEKEFLGRAGDMQRLKKKLENASKVVLMNGLGGIGKTVLATAYVQQFGRDYDHLAWINRGEDLIESVASNEFLADTLGLPFEQEEELKVRFGRILRKLHQMPGQNLLVIDNAQEQVAQKKIYDLLPGLPNWRVLLTSRLPLSGFDRLPLDTLRPDASRTLFRTYFRGACTEEELEALLQEIGYHTLTIELLAKLLHKLNGILSVTELLTILRQKQLDDPDLQETVWARHSGEERSIYLHLMKAFELSRLEEREKWLLKQFVVLPVERYLVTTLADFLQEKPLGLNKTLNSLAAKGWLTLHDDQTFSIHRLIRQVAEYQLQTVYADVQALVESMIQKMNVDGYNSPIAATVPWMNYATTVADFFITEKHEPIAALQNNIATTYSALGQYEQALGYHQKAQAILEVVLESNHPELAQSHNNIAETYRALGKYEQALGYHQKAQSIWEAVLEANHPYLATSYNNIALTYRDLGQYEQALGYHQKAQSIWESVLETNHPDLATSYNNIAITYRDLGQYKQALGYHQKALVIEELCWKPTIPTWPPPTIILR